MSDSTLKDASQAIQGERLTRSERQAALVRPSYTIQGEGQTSITVTTTRDRTGVVVTITREGLIPPVVTGLPTVAVAAIELTRAKWEALCDLAFTLKIESEDD